MAQATTTANGQVILGGDLAGGGDGSFPELRPSGVTPGRYAPIGRATFDNKGRMVYAVNMTKEDIRPLIARATKTQRGVVLPGLNLTITGSVLNVPTATSAANGIFSVAAPLQNYNGTVVVDLNTAVYTSKTTRGVTQIGTGLDVAAGVVSVPETPYASATVKGLIGVGNNFDVQDGVVSLPDATTTTKGIASIEAPLFVTGGVVGINTAANFTKGIVQVGSGLNVNNGVMSVAIAAATSNTPGFIKFSDDFQVYGGVFSLNLEPTTAGRPGLMQVGSGLSVAGGVITPVYPTATTTTKGMVQVGTGLTVNNGVVATNLPYTTNGSLGLAQAGNGIDVTNGILSLTRPDATTTTKGIAQAGAGMNIAGGVLAVSTVRDATTSVKGIVSINTAGYLSITNGVVSYNVPDATTSSRGIVQIGENSGLTLAGGVLTSAIASTAAKGIVKPGAGMAVTAGVLNVVVGTTDATTTTKGVVSFDDNVFTVVNARASVKPASYTTAGVARVGTTLTNASGAINFNSSFLKKNVATTYTRAQSVARVTIPYAPTVTPDFASSNSFEITMTGDMTLANPINVTPGGVYTLVITHGATTGTLTLGSAYKTNAPVVLSTTENAIDVLTFICGSTEIYVMINQGFSD